MTNRIIYMPENFEEVVKAPRKSIILARSTDYSQEVTKGGIHLPPGFGEEDSYEKKLSVGRVVTVGDEVESCKKGDIVIYVKSTAQRMPDGNNPDYENPRYVRIDDSSVCITAILPPEEKDDAESET